MWISRDVSPISFLGGTKSWQKSKERESRVQKKTSQSYTSGQTGGINSSTVVDANVNIKETENSSLILRDVTRKKKIKNDRSHVLTDSAVSEVALRSNTHMHPERMVSFRPDAHRALLLAHAQRIWGLGVGEGLTLATYWNTTFVAYDLLNASAWGT